MPSKVAKTAYISWLFLILTVPIAAAAEQRVRLRLEWGGGQPTLWSGLLEISKGRFENPRSLGIEAGDPGTIWIEGDAVWIQRRTPRTYDGFDVTVVAHPTATLNMTLQSPDREALREQLSVRISELTRNKHTLPIGRDGTRLIIDRTPGDALAVRIDRQHLIFEPGDRFSTSVALNLLPRPASEVAGRLHWQLTKARSKTTINNGSQSLQVAKPDRPTSVSLDIELPEQEGVYDIRLDISGRGLPEEQSTVQVVVLGSDPPRKAQVASAQVQDKLVDSFRPADAGLFRKVESGRRFKFFDFRDHRLDKLLELIPWLGQESTSDAFDSNSHPLHARHDSHVSWKAYRLRVDHPGRPHRVVVSAPANSSQTLGISLIEPNAAKQLMPVGLDTGVYFSGSSGNLPASGEVESTKAAQHKFTVWPNIRSPILLLHDLGTGQPIHVNKVELYELQRGLSRGAGAEARGQFL